MCVLCVHAHVCVHQDSQRVGELYIRMVEGMVFIHPREGSRWISSPTSYTEKVVEENRHTLFKRKHRDKLQAQAASEKIPLR